MCPKRIEMKYVENSARYDNETRIMLNNFLKYKNPRHKFQPIGQYYKNICWLNETRRAVTKDCCERYVKNKRSCEINFKYKSQIEKYQVCIGMPLIATQNMKKRDMFNMMEFALDNITGGRQTFIFSDSSDEDDTPYVYNENGLKQLHFVVNKEDSDYNEFRESVLQTLQTFAIQFINTKVVKLMSIIIFGIHIKWISKRCTQVYLEQQSSNIFILTTKKYVEIIENDLKIK